MTSRSFILFCSILVLESGHAAAVRKIVVDQVGYRPGLAKYAFVSSIADSFGVYDASTHALMFSGPLNIWHSNDPASGKTIRRGDFSAFQQIGEFYLVTSAGDTSELFSISDTVYSDAWRKALKGYYFQRCGMNLEARYAGVYAHPPCHMGDGIFHASTDSSGIYRKSTGGWHDAGDYGKYVVNAGISVGTLLMAYEYFPARFAADNLNIPESGNGVPDILDEVRYELAWLLTMQRSDGGVDHKLTREQFEGFIPPQNDNATRYLYQVTSTATGDFAAVMARAARVYLPFDSTFAHQCRDAAVAAWSFIASHGSIVPPGGFQNPSGTVTGEYGDGNDLDERLWAAAELFVTTGGSEYNVYYQSKYSSHVFDYPMGWQDVRNMANITYLESPQPATDGTVRQQLKNALNSFCNSEVALRNTSGYQVVLRTDDYYWGSNSVALNAAMLLLIGYEEFSTQTFLDVAADQMHYILGANAHDLSFVTGVGKHSVMHPHHRPSESDGIADPVPGLMAGGPNKDLLDDYTLRVVFDSSTPPALCYIDTVSSYACNEIAINWNAPLVFVLGYFDGSGATSIHELPRQAVPSGIELRQNYPNPFNGGTRIGFRLSASDRVELVVVDVLGRVVDREDLGTFSAGENSCAWQAVNSAGKPLSSGVYVYYLKGRQRSELRKLLLLR